LGLDSLSKSGSLYAHTIERDIWGDTKGRFRPDFVQLEYKPTDKDNFNRAVAFWKQQSPALVQYIDSNNPRPTENEYTQRFCNIANRTADIIHGVGKGPRLAFGDRELERNSSLVFHEGHGGDWTADGNKVKPDIHAMDPNKVNPDLANWIDVWLAAEAKLRGRTDMKSSDPTPAENIVRRTLYCQVSALCSPVHCICLICFPATFDLSEPASQESPRNRNDADHHASWPVYSTMDCRCFRVRYIPAL
jgi:hypothetical protein